MIITISNHFFQIDFKHILARYLARYVSPFICTDGDSGAAAMFLPDVEPLVVESTPTPDIHPGS